MDIWTIRKARQANLSQYLINRGEKLKRNGQRYRHAEHNSLVFTDNAYYWNARGEHGNSIDFLMRFYGMSFETAISELTGERVAEQKTGEPLLENPFTFSDVSLCSDMRRSIAYLTKTRGIKYRLIKRLIDEKYIFQEKGTNNILFPIYDENHQIVGAETVGTLSGFKFKGIKAGSKYGYGFNIPVSKPLKYALFFESAIDLISFMELEQAKGKLLTGCLLVSLSGVKENIVENMVKAFSTPSEPLKCVLSPDNDEAGYNLIEHVKMQHSANKTLLRAFLPDRQYKDWNEQLKASKELKVKSTDRVL